MFLCHVRPVKPEKSMLDLSVGIGEKAPTLRRQTQRNRPLVREARALLPGPVSPGRQGRKRGPTSSRGPRPGRPREQAGVGEAPGCPLLLPSRGTPSGISRKSEQPPWREQGGKQVTQGEGTASLQTRGTLFSLRRDVMRIFLFPQLCLNTLAGASFCETTDRREGTRRTAP